MRKKILYTLLYFVAVAGFIFALAYTRGLMGDEMMVIWILAILLFLAFQIFRAVLRAKRRAKSKRAKKKRARPESDLPMMHPESPKPASPSRPRRKLRIIFAVPALLITGLLCYRIWHEWTYIPENIIQFGERYPEAAEFVADYPREKNRNHRIDLSDEVQQGSIPLFIQWDKRWGYESYGNDCIGLSGCGPTCMSMVLCGLTGDTGWNPYELSKFSQEQGYYVSGQGTSWELMTAGAETLGLTAASGEVSADCIIENLMHGAPIICSMYPGDFTYTGHFIVLTGMASDGTIIVNDPNSPKNSEKHWSIDVLLPQIRSLWIYHL